MTARLAFMTLAFLGCGTLSDGSRVVPPPPGAPIDCTSAAVRQCGPAGVGSVNTCLAGSDESWHGCLVGLLGPGDCGAETVLACVVRHSQSVSRENVARNPADTVSARQAERAAAWIEERRYLFQP